MKKLLSLTALGLALTLGAGAHAAEDAKAPTKQQSKMATCNKDAGDMKGDELEDALTAYGSTLENDLSTSAMNKMPASKIVNPSSSSNS